MEIAELVLTIISTIVAVFSFFFSLISKKEAKEVKDEINFIIQNNPGLQVSNKYKDIIKKRTHNVVKGNNNTTAGGDINVHK